MDRCLDQQKYLGTKWAISICIFVLLFRIEKVTIANEFKTCKQEPPITMVENLKNYSYSYRIESMLFSTYRFISPKNHLNEIVTEIVFNKP